MNSQKISIKRSGPSPKAYRKETRMNGTIKSPRSARLNLEGIDLPALQRFIHDLPLEAQRGGKITIHSQPYINQFDRGSTSLEVSWSVDLGPAPAA